MKTWLPLHALWFVGLAAYACGPADTTSGPAGSGSALTAASGAPVAADGKPVPQGTREGSTVARSPESDMLVVANEDQKALELLPLPIHDASKSVRVETPGRPAQVAVIGNKVLVTVREMPDASGALMVYERTGTGTIELGEPRTVSLPADAWGIAVSPDGSRALVTSPWTAKVSLVDLTSLAVLWTRDVAREPRGATFLADGDSAYVSHLVEAPLTRIDKIGSEAVVTRVELPASPLRSPPQTRLDASLGYAIVLSPERDRLFAPRHALGTLGPDVWFGSATVDVLDTKTSKPLGTRRQINAHSAFVSFFTSQGSGALPVWWAAASNVMTEGTNVFVQPRAVVYRKSQKTLLVASEGTDRIAELDALMSDPTIGRIRSYDLATDRDPHLGAALHGGAPSGIVLSADEKIAFVHCRSTDEVAVIHLPEGEGSFETVPPFFVKLGEDAGDAEYVMGRRLFYDATDYHVSGGLACAGCHPEGRDDGYVWHQVSFDKGVDKAQGFTNFIGSASAARHLAEAWKGHVPEPSNVEATGAGFARQTPMLVGRLKSQGPYGWRAEDKDLPARLYSGFSLHRWRGGVDDKSSPVIARAHRLMKFVRTGLVPPPVPKRELSAEEERGRVIFTSASSECATCHTPESDYTNRSVAMFPDAMPRQAYLQEKGAAYKTPSLLFVGGSPPYFHDGRYATLEELVEKNADRMGKTNHLSEEDKKALVAFLKTL